MMIILANDYENEDVLCPMVLDKILLFWMTFWITLATFSVKCTLTTIFLGDFGKILFGQLFIPTSGHTGNPSANWTPIPTLLYLRTKVIWKRYISTSFWRRQNVTQTTLTLSIGIIWGSKDGLILMEWLRRRQPKKTN